MGHAESWHVHCCCLSVRTVRSGGFSGDLKKLRDLAGHTAETSPHKSRAFTDIYPKRHLKEVLHRPQPLARLFVWVGAAVQFTLSGYPATALVTPY